MLIEKARKTIVEYQMLKSDILKNNNTVTVGLSGGADSVALLHFLYSIREEFGIRLQAVHLHHGLRGADADHDADFAMEFSKQRDIHCEIVMADVLLESKKRGLGTEETGRLLRYEAFERFAGGGLIAVAHTENDQAETVLMRLCRGAGARGLSGIRPTRGNIIRPLLYCSRAEIEAYCEEQGLCYCTDKTNFENDYSRNKIRNRLLPWLCSEMNAKAVENIAKTAEILAEEEKYMEEAGVAAMAKTMVFQNAQEIALNRAALLQYPIAIRRRVFRHALFLLSEVFSDFSQYNIDELDKLLSAESGKSISLPHGLQGETEFQSLIIYINKPENKEYCYVLQPEKTIFIKEINKCVKLSYNTESRNFAKNYKNNFIQNFTEIYTGVFDYDKIDAILCCRSRQPGDRLQIGGGHSKKLKDYFIDEKIPRRQRDVPLIAFGNEILWVVGKRSSKGFEPCTATKNTVVIEIWEDNGNERKCGNAHRQNGNK